MRLATLKPTLRPWTWTYESLNDAMSCLDETVEALESVLKNSETLQPNHPEAGVHVEAIKSDIERVKRVKEHLMHTRRQYWLQFTKDEGVNLAALAIAPFRKLV